MKLFVGLGNPGEQYSKTRHNVGFMVLDKYVSDLNLEWKISSKFNSFVAQQEDILFLKPQTFMNKSGESVSKAVQFYKVNIDDVVVVHDDVDLELGKVRIQKGAGSAGHRGVESVTEQLGTKEYWRIRLGVGRPENENIDVEDWVLMTIEEESTQKLVEIGVAELQGIIV